MVGAPRRAPFMDLVLDKGSTLPLYLQLKYHVMHLISSGVWQPGMPIPSVRQLAADLGLATATVQRAYGELQDFGVLVGQAGRGVFVADLASGVPEIPGERRNVLHSLLARAISHALSLGFTQQEIAATVHQLVTGRNRADRPAQVVFVGSTSETTDKYQRLLAVALADLPVEVAGVTIAEIRADPDALLDRLEPVRCLVGLVRAFAEVRRLAVHRGMPIFALVVDLTPATCRRIQDLPPDRPIGVIAEEAYLTSARTIVHRCRGLDPGEHEHVLWAESRNRRAIQRVIQTCPTIVHTFGVTKLLTRLAPDHQLIELEYLPTAASIEQLREIVEAKAPAAAV
ncbi:MAG: GntR family transcriptional regulator [Chloroflexi bacterium]|nr:GntR family transcriptional regulator [Chloroflexota bacterium]